MKYSVAAHESLQMVTRVAKLLKIQEKSVQELNTELLEKYKKLEKEQTVLKRKVSNINNEVSALQKAMEKQDDHLKILEAQLTSKTYNIEEGIWEKLNHVLTIRDGAIQHQMQHIQKDLNLFYTVLMCIRGCCPFIHNYDNPVVKLADQIL